MDWHGINLQWAYGDLLLALSRRTQCVHSAYDVLHDAFVRYVLAQRRVPVEQPNAYLRRVAHSVLTDRYRHARRYVPLPEGDYGEEPLISARANLDCAPSPEQLADLQQRLAAVQRVVDCLPPRCREVFWLARIEGYRQREIAALLGVSLNAVERQLIRAMLELRKAKALLQP